MLILATAGPPLDRNSLAENPRQARPCAVPTESRGAADQRRPSRRIPASWPQAQRAGRALASTAWRTGAELYL